MNYSERITDLNFDTENEEAQDEAKELKTKLSRYAKICYAISLTGIVLCLTAFIILAVYTVLGFEEGILYSIIPLALGLGFTVILLLGGYYRGLSKDIIINEEEKNNG